jgi:hypothetical protein
MLLATLIIINVTAVIVARVARHILTTTGHRIAPAIKPCPRR